MPEKELQLMRTEAPAPLPSVAQMLDAVIKGGVNETNVGVLDKLLGLYERVQAKDAEKEFAKAFRSLQDEMPKVKAEEIVPDRSGKTKFKFARYETIMDQIEPLLKKHGFTVSFSQKMEADRVTVSCFMQHLAGHTRETTFTVRVGSGPYGASETQADGAAGTYAKRFAICDALNIKISKAAGDADDPHIEGRPISKKLAEELQRRCMELNADVAKFLKLADAKSFEEIAEGAYPVLDNFLREKERRGK
jgi:hypothetical protein